MIGELDQRVSLISASEVNDGGEVSIVLTEVETVWAKVISQKGSEAFESARTSAKETIRLKIRYRSDIKADWQVTWMGQSYSIVHLDRSERRQGYLWMTAEAPDVS